MRDGEGLPQIAKRIEPGGKTTVLFVVRIRDPFGVGVDARKDARENLIWQALLAVQLQPATTRAKIFQCKLPKIFA